MLLALLLLTIFGFFVQAFVLLFVLERTAPLLAMHERLIHMEGHLIELSEAMSQHIMNMELNATTRMHSENIQNTDGLKELFEHLAEDEDEDDDEDEEDNYNG